LASTGWRLEFRIADFRRRTLRQSLGVAITSKINVGYQLIDFGFITDLSMPALLIRAHTCDPTMLTGGF
jgi:hypothetical protein